MGKVRIFLGNTYGMSVGDKEIVGEGLDKGAASHDKAIGPRGGPSWKKIRDGQRGCV